MRTIVALFVMAGCADGVDIDVYASKTGIAVSYDRYAGNCSYIPPVGECVHSTDVGTCELEASACVRTVRYRGVGGTAALDGMPASRWLDAVPDGSALRIEGCGQTAVVGLGTVDLVAPTLSFGSGTQLVWSASAGATSYVVWRGGGFSGDICHVPADVTQMDGGLYSSFLVDALALEGELSTAVGDVRVWSRADSERLIRDQP